MQYNFGMGRVITNEDLNISHAFRKRIEKFKESLYPGMTLKVMLYTGDQKVDGMREAKVVAVNRHIVVLKDSKGLMYGPDYAQLLMWGN